MRAFAPILALALLLPGFSVQAADTADKVAKAKKLMNCKAKADEQKLKHKPRQLFIKRCMGN